MDSQDLASLCAKIADEKKANNITVLAVTDLMVITDFLVICSADNERQVQTIAKEIQTQLKPVRHKKANLEGAGEGKWILMDYGDVIVHVLLDEMREYYELEKLWADAPIVKWQSSLEPLTTS